MSRPVLPWVPRGLNRAQAASYIGVSPGTFDRLVAEGKMPTPKRVGARVLFDREAIDLAFSVLGEDSADRNDWDV